MSSKLASTEASGAWCPGEGQCPGVPTTTLKDQEMEPLRVSPRVTRKGGSVYTREALHPQLEV